MTRPPLHELIVSERPVRSDYGRERSYARRRFITLLILAVALGGAAYDLWGRGAPNPADIPTIKAEDGAYRQKPADPGGIDIPHQDVRVYDQLESKNGAQPQVEHLLPPPETPKETPHAAPVASAVAPVAEAVPSSPPVSTVAPTVASSVPSEILPSESAAKNRGTTVAQPPIPLAAPAPDPAPITPVAAKASVPIVPKAEALTIDQVIARTKTAPVLAAVAPVSVQPEAAVASGKTVIQLASLPNEAQAQALMQNLQQRYAAKLGSATLHLVRADLGSRGIFYRIQSQGLAEGDANHICSSLKQVNAGCFLVRK